MKDYGYSSINAKGGQIFSAAADSPGMIVQYLIVCRSWYQHLSSHHYCNSYSFAA